MSLRYGPSFVADVTAPSPGPTPLPGKVLVDILASPGEVTEATDGSGTFFLGVVIDIPAYSIDTHRQVLRVHAVGIPEGFTLPGDPKFLLETATIQGSVEVAGMVEGTRQVISLGGIGLGKMGVQTVIQDED